MPILGVCLGHQILGVYFGARIKTLKNPMHGKVSEIITQNKFKLYENLNSSFMATRYHSLYLDSKNFPKNLLISARSNDDNIIMSFRHKDFPIYGLQYHPESIETKVGNTILDNFLNIL
jgi:anthranilate synthase/aminodeoxychorismate synthase-like glutamine amidotransferase